ncbi:MAG: FecR domain-containing protein [Candidatus Gastranaerophilales bacterium]|nr:FecR domain-containing protein [Candidatus Gastranaerophilales bacterium]
MDKRKLTLAGGIAAAAVVLVAAVVMILKLNGQTDTYRDISVFELNASANVTRDGTTLDAYQGMHLENGDRILVGDGGYIRLLLDNDKYVTLEAGTEICLHATGDSTDSKTEIELVCGAVLNEIDNKLSANSSYELSTPTSVMAVRGTVFRVALTQEGEASNVNLIVLDGQVASAPVLSDGTVSSETILVGAGEALNISKPDAHSDPVCTPAEISYEDLPADALACILDIYQTGRLNNLSVTQEILEQLYEEKSASQQTDAIVNPAQAQVTPETTEAAKPSASSNGQDSTTSSSQAATRPNTGNTSSSASSKPSAPASSAQANNTASSTNSKPSVPASSAAANNGNATTAVQEPVQPSLSDDSDYPDDSDSPDQPSQPNQPDSPDQPSQPVLPDSPDQPSQPDQPDRPDQPSQPDQPNRPDQPSDPDQPDHQHYYTVTFMDASGNLFGTQYVVSGAQAQRPLLSPVGGSIWCDASGNAFDFDCAVTADLTLYYR